jgi:hypothetical protein
MTTSQANEHKLMIYMNYVASGRGTAYITLQRTAICLLEWTNPRGHLAKLYKSNWKITEM